jgi:hypothetical protein
VPSSAAIAVLTPPSGASDTTAGVTSAVPSTAGAASVSGEVAPTSTSPRLVKTASSSALDVLSGVLATAGAVGDQRASPRRRTSSTESRSPVLAVEDADNGNVSPPLFHAVAPVALPLSPKSAALSSPVPSTAESRRGFGTEPAAVGHAALRAASTAEDDAAAASVAGSKAVAAPETLAPRSAPTSVSSSAASVTATAASPSPAVTKPVVVSRSGSVHVTVHQVSGVVACRRLAVALMQDHDAVQMHGVKRGASSTSFFVRVGLDIGEDKDVATARTLAVPPIGRGVRWVSPSDAHLLLPYTVQVCFATRAQAPRVCVCV